jgi:hypothetical protein
MLSLPALLVSCIHATRWGRGGGRPSWLSVCQRRSPAAPAPPGPPGRGPRTRCARWPAEPIAAPPRVAPSSHVRARARRLRHICRRTGPLAAPVDRSAADAGVKHTYQKYRGFGGAE